MSQMRRTPFVFVCACACTCACVSVSVSVRVWWSDGWFPAAELTGCFGCSGCFGCFVCVPCAAAALAPGGVADAVLQAAHAPALGGEEAAHPLCARQHVFTVWKVHAGNLFALMPSVCVERLVATCSCLGCSAACLRAVCEAAVFAIWSAAPERLAFAAVRRGGSHCRGRGITGAVAHCPDASWPHRN